MKRRDVLGGAGLLALAGGSAAVGLRRMGSMTDYDRSVAQMRAPLSAHPDIEHLVRFATLAPNGHNTQPWAFHVAADRIEISPDFARRTPVVDPDDHHIFVDRASGARPRTWRSPPQPAGVLAGSASIPKRTAALTSPSVGISSPHRRWSTQYRAASPRARSTTAARSASPTWGNSPQRPRRRAWIWFSSRIVAKWIGRAT